MSDFKVGDKVRRIGGNCAGTVTGGIYTVKRFRLPRTIMLLEFPEDNLGWSASYFELAPQVGEFKVGDTVRCIDSYRSQIIIGAVYTIASIEGEFLRVTDDLGDVGGYKYTRFELAQEPVLTPEEVLQYFKEERQDELECVQPNGLVLDNMTKYTGVKYILEYKWYIKPVPEIIEANGRKYKLIEE